MFKFLSKHSTLSIFILAIFVVLSYIFLISYITPFILETVGSDAFMEDTGDYRSDDPVDNHFTEIAASQCFDHLSKNFDIGNTDLTNIKYNTWALGGYRYIVKSKISASPNEDALIMGCQIQYDYKTEEPNNSDNWDIIGFSYNGESS